jgi:carbonic anhydrase
MSLFSLFLAALLPTQALDSLKEGNVRFSQGKSLHPNQSEQRRMATQKGQAPFAVIVGCSDSRVSPEIIFDQGIGDVFIVRVAGNVVGPIELDSIEFAAAALHSPLIVVLGHQNCGAVNAVLQGQTKDIEAIASQIEPAAKQTKNIKKDRLEKTIKVNAQLVVDHLKKTPVLQSLIEKQQLEIVPAYYHFDSGQVEWLP